jgi:CheY-like chemotaxis protein
MLRNILSEWLKSPETLFLTLVNPGDPYFMKTGPRTTILLAEDDLDDQELLAKAFYEVEPSIILHSFSTGTKFMEYLEGLSLINLPDLVLLDYNIPEMNGPQILNLLKGKEKYNNIVKLVWSTSNSPLFEYHSRQAGAVSYLIKPSNISGLIELVKHILSFLR